MEYSIDETKKQILTTGELMDIMLKYYYMVPESFQKEFDKEADLIISSYKWMQLRLQRSESERFNK